MNQDQEGTVAVEQLLQSFLEHSSEPISKHQDLAKRMAQLAHMIRDSIITAFEQKEASHNLRDLYQSFQHLLIPDLKESEFADMFAQTMAYSLFAARYNHTGKSLFRREDAAKEIPRTNLFLRKLFAAIVGSDLEDEPFVRFVDELAQVLAFTDMDAVLADFSKHTRQEDPIVHFYEIFLAQYDPNLRALRGVYYTPEPVVSYIVRSVDHLLCEHFDCPDGLADTNTIPYSFIDENGNEHVETRPRVLILDPATGTGTFLYQVIAHIRESYQQMGNASMWSSHVRQHLLPRLFGFELLMAPYTMAHIKLAMQLAAIDLPKEERSTWGYDFASDERLGIYLTNTLDEAHKRSDMLFGRSILDEANQAAKVRQSYPVMVILGNPPYSGHSANKGDWINDLLQGKDPQTGRATGNYFEIDGQPLGERNPKYLHDDYVKFIRFAQWRIEKTGYGILAFITNHSYLDNPTFRGMRQSLIKSFDHIYILDLHGNSKKKERSPDGTKDENVFDIQQGVAIGIFVKRQQQAGLSNIANIYHADLWGPREVYEQVEQEHRLVGGKYHWLAEHDITTTEWTKIELQPPFYLLKPQNNNIGAEYEQAWKITNIFKFSSNGFKTHRDHFTVAFNAAELRSRIELLLDINMSDEELAARFGLSNTETWELATMRRKLRGLEDWTKPIMPCLYRPLDVRSCYYGQFLMDRPRENEMWHTNFPNICIATGRQGQVVGSDEWNLITVGRNPADTNLFYRGGIQYFSLYLYPKNTKLSLFDADELSNTPGVRSPNLSLTFVNDVTNHLHLKFISNGRGDLQQTFGPEDIFNYIYAIFHAPSYRERYAEFLKIDFPRLPLTSNVDLFRELCRLGDILVGLHLMEKLGQITTRFPIPGDYMVEKIDYTSPANAPEQGRVWINKTQYIEGVPPEVWEFHIGGYRVCQKWLKDRKGRKLEFNDIKYYQHIVATLAETIQLMGQIDEVIDGHGGWPIQ